MHFNPFEQRPSARAQAFMDWNTLYPKPYDNALSQSTRKQGSS